jgi:dienelactone hydrolase
MSSPCCPPDALPALKVDYKPKGEQFELPAVPSCSCTCQLYLIGASESDATWKGKGPVLVMMCDVLGPFSGNHRKLADEFASQTGGIALLPDLFEGSGGLVPQYRDEDDKPNQFGFNSFTWNAMNGLIWKLNPFVKRYPWSEKHQYLFKDQLIPFLQSKGIEKFALMGFCYGCWIIMKACNDDVIAEHVTCGIHYHPSAEAIESTFGGNDIDLCKTVKRPQLIHATKNESSKWKPGGAAHKALEENENCPEVQFSLAPKTQSHGFMTRADTSVDQNREAVKEAVDMAVAFLKKYNNSS